VTGKIVTDRRRLTRGLVHSAGSTPINVSILDPHRRSLTTGLLRDGFANLDPAPTRKVRRLRGRRADQEPCWAEHWRWVPSVLHDSFVTDGATFADGAEAQYPLIAFPREPWTLTAYTELGQVQAGEWADWLN
jgi:hypothetical protein